MVIISIEEPTEAEGSHYEELGMGQEIRKIAEAEGGQLALKPATARRIMIRAFEIGQMSMSPRFYKRSGNYAFTTVDAEMLIRHGKIVDESYDAEFNSLVYRITGRVDGRKWEITVALDSAEDYWDSPWLTLTFAKPVFEPKKEREK